MILKRELKLSQMQVHNYGLGAVLVQKYPDGPRVVSYASKSLSPVERRYSQTEREALALV